MDRLVRRHYGIRRKFSRDFAKELKARRIQTTLRNVLLGIVYKISSCFGTPEAEEAVLRNAHW